VTLADSLKAFLTRGPAGPAAVAAAHFEEATGSVNVDPDDDLYRSVSAGYRDLVGPLLSRAQTISVNLYRKNPLANRIIKIYTTYMAGEGFTVEAANPDVAAVVDEFWQAERNQMESNHRRFARDGLIFGEAPHPVAADETGNTTVGYLDPHSIDHVKTDPRNQLILTDLVLRRAGGDEEKLRIVRRDEDPFSETAGLLAGDVFLWLHDRIGAATRGTPFLLPAVDWLDAYDQILWELLERTKAVRAFFWDVEVDGGATEIEIAKKEWGRTAPRSGSVRFRTPAIQVAASQPQLGAYEDVNTARFILRHIATAAGVAPTWIGDPEDANRSTAEQMDKPVLRALTDTQAQWKYNMERLLAYAVDQKIGAGMLDRVVERFDSTGQGTGDMQPASKLIKVTAPAITDDDVTGAAAALTSVAQAFMQLDVIGIGDPETMRRIVRTMLPALGLPADELPDPDEADDRQIAQAVESIRRRAIASGKLPELEERLRKLDEELTAA
jgi:hypothetical protein